MFAAPRPAGTLSASGRLALEAGALLALAWPLILANLAVTVMTTTDYVMLGLLSPGALAAGALGFNLYQPIFLLGVGVVGALSPIAAKKIGGGEAHEGVRRATHQAFLSALLIAAAGWLLLSQTTAILTAIGEPPDLARDAGRYMRAYQWALAPSLMFFAARSVFAALERPRLPLLAGLVAVVFNALANYVLIFGKFGLPALGIAGSGLATTLSQTLMLGLLVAFSLIDPRLRRLRLFALPWRPALRRTRRAVAARPADRPDDHGGGRDLRRREPGDGTSWACHPRGAYDRAADRGPRLHGPAGAWSGRFGPDRPRLWRA